MSHNEENGKDIKCHKRDNRRVLIDRVLFRILSTEFTRARERKLGNNIGAGAVVISSIISVEY